MDPETASSTIPSRDGASYAEHQQPDIPGPPPQPTPVSRAPCSPTPAWRPAYRSERSEFRSRLDALVQTVRPMPGHQRPPGQAAYRLKAWSRARGIPVLPWIAHRFAMMTAQISIGDDAVIKPGVFIPHGQIVITGVTVVHARAVLLPWNVGADRPRGRRAHDRSASEDRNGAKRLGEVTWKRDARVGANSVVLNDVPPDTTVVGAPAKGAAD